MSDIDLVKKVRVYAEEAEKNGFDVLTVPLRDLFPLLGRMEAAERERYQLREDGERNLRLAGENAVRALKAEAELIRRDAAAGEPVGLQCMGDSGRWQDCSSREVAESHGFTIFRELYTATPPAVMPDIDGYTHGLFPHAVEQLTRFRDDALALGAQQQKVVELPALFNLKIAGDVKTKQYFKGSNDTIKQIAGLLDAAGVKWEVKK